MQAFRDHLLSRLEEEVGDGTNKFEDEFGFPMSDLASLLDGDGTLAVIRPGPGPLAAVAFLDTGDHPDILGQLQAKINEVLDAEPKVTTETDTIDGTEVTVHTIETGEAQMPTVDVCYFIKDGQVVVSSSVVALESVLERWDGDHESTLADSRMYKSFMETCATSDGSVPDMIWFVKPVELTLGVLQSIPQTQFYGAMAAGFLPQFGINTLRGFGGTVELNSDEFSSITRTLLAVDQPPRGIFKIFEFRPTLSEVPPWVPAAVGQYFAFDWNLQGAYDTVEQLYDTWIGRQPGSFDRTVVELTRNADGFNLHLKDDVIDALSGRVHAYYTPPENNDPSTVDVVAAIGIADQEKATRLIDFVLERAEAVREGNVAGREVKFVTAGEVDFAIAQTDDTIYVASGLNQLKQALSGEAAEGSLINSNNYAKAKPHLPAKYSFFSYQTPAESFRTVYEQARNGELDSTTEGEIDFSLLPPFAEIEKYFVPTFTYSKPTDDGTYSEQFSFQIDE